MLKFDEKLFDMLRNIQFEELAWEAQDGNLKFRY
jgi:hypothetical protein